MKVHKQQVKSDEWYTPKYIFEALACDFDMDVASPIDRTFCNVPAKTFITENSLNSKWDGFVWVNPPYSGKKEDWMNKIAQHGNGIALTPDATSAEWWQNAAKQADAILQTSGRIKFVRPDGSVGGQPANGTTLFAYGEKAIEALLRAEKNGLGKVFFCRNSYATLQKNIPFDLRPEIPLGVDNQVQKEGSDRQSS